MANYLRFPGYQARTHTATATELDLDAMLSATGLGAAAEHNGEGVEVPFIGRGYGVAVVSTDMELAVDLPLAPAADRAAGTSGGGSGRAAPVPDATAGHSRSARFIWDPIPWRRSSGSRRRPR